MLGNEYILHRFVAFLSLSAAVKIVQSFLAEEPFPHKSTEDTVIYAVKHTLLTFA